MKKSNHYNPLSKIPREMWQQMPRTLRKIARGYQAPDPLQRRAELAAEIAEKSEHGRIAVVQSGMDCDGCVYDGWVADLPATVMNVERHAREVARWADGPFSLELQPVSVACRLIATSRDLALEAFENGHQHVLSLAESIAARGHRYE